MTFLRNHWKGLGSIGITLLLVEIAFASGVVWAWLR